jgi:hypothetical protein
MARRSGFFAVLGRRTLIRRGSLLQWISIFSFKNEPEGGSEAIRRKGLLSLLTVTEVASLLHCSKAHVWHEVGVVWPHKTGKGFDIVIHEGISVNGRIVCTNPRRTRTASNREPPAGTLVPVGGFLSTDQRTSFTEMKQCPRPPTRRQLEQLQIEEYMATNRHRPGDHTFRIISEADIILPDKPKD